MKRSVLIGVILLQVLLMGAAFVGGRTMAGQNQRNAGQSLAAQLPSQLPKEPMAGSGSVQKVQNNIITLSQGGGGPGVHQAADQGCTGWWVQHKQWNRGRCFV